MAKTFKAATDTLSPIFASIFDAKWSERAKRGMKNKRRQKGGRARSAQKQHLLGWSRSKICSTANQK
jgi:hypothetical protein